MVGIFLILVVVGFCQEGGMRGGGGWFGFSFCYFFFLALIVEIPLMLSFKTGFAIPFRIDILLVEVGFIFYFV